MKNGKIISRTNVDNFHFITFVVHSKFVDAVFFSRFNKSWSLCIYQSLWSNARIAFSTVHGTYNNVSDWLAFNMKPEKWNDSYTLFFFSLSLLPSSSPSHSKIKGEFHIRTHQPQHTGKHIFTPFYTLFPWSHFIQGRIAKNTCQNQRPASKAIISSIIITITVIITYD